MTLLDRYVQRVGETLTSSYLVVTQDRINQFAEATSDKQWLHVDEARAAGGAFGATIAHGYLTLSLLSYFMNGSGLFPAGYTVINYGLERVRFITPVRVGSRIRNVARLTDAKEKSGGVLLTVENTVDIEGEGKPAMTAVSLALVLEA